MHYYTGECTIEHKSTNECKTTRSPIDSLFLLKKKKGERTVAYQICRGPALVRLEFVIALRCKLLEPELAIVVTGEGCKSCSR